MELILKIEMTKLTDDAKKALAYFISISDPKPVKTELEKKLESSVEKVAAVKQKSAKVEQREKSLKEKLKDADEEEKEFEDYRATFEGDEEISENGVQTITLDLIKEKVIALRDKGKRDKTLKLMAKFNIAKLSDLDEDDYDTFYNSLNNIK